MNKNHAYNGGVACDASIWEYIMQYLNKENIFISPFIISYSENVWIGAELVSMVTLSAIAHQGILHLDKSNLTSTKQPLFSSP